MDWLNKIFRPEPIEEDFLPLPEEKPEEPKPRPKHDPTFDPDYEPVVLDTKPESPHFDEHSANWQFVKSEIERSIDHWRKLNDKPADAEKTAWTRGRIQQLKDLLNLPQTIRADRKAPQ